MNWGREGLELKREKTGEEKTKKCGVRMKMILAGVWHEASDRQKKGFWYAVFGDSERSMEFK